MTFIKQIFQDIDGSYSSKRTAFFIFIFLFVAISCLTYLDAVPVNKIAFAQSSLDKLSDLIKWLGGFIVAEHATKLVQK